MVGNNLQTSCTSQFQYNHSSEEIQEETNEQNQQNNSKCTHGSVKRVTFANPQLYGGIDGSVLYSPKFLKCFDVSVVSSQLMTLLMGHRLTVPSA